MPVRPGAPAYTEAERDRYVAILCDWVGRWGRSPTPSEFLLACDHATSRRPYRCLQKLLGLNAWADIVVRLGMPPLPTAYKKRVTRQSQRSVNEGIRYEGKKYAHCLNAPYCTGKPAHRGLRYCVACDPRGRSEGIADGFEMRGVRVRG